ncbi:MAG TPA: hypothetical protein VGY99_20695 [Candidatus Binataceae bacterium]|jgi:hypothetical protein|nr:hypothetical protein [Candidatus Binataceae bacterium]
MLSTIKSYLRFHRNTKRALLFAIAPVTLAAALSLVPAPAALAASTPTPSATPSPTYSGVLFFKAVSSPITVAAGQSLHGIAPVSGTSPNAAQYGVTARAIVYAQAGSTDTTCMVKLAGGAVWGTAITVPANSTVSIPFEDTSPGFPGEQYNIAIMIQAGSGGSLKILPGTSLTIEGIASQPGNNAY